MRIPHDTWVMVVDGAQMLLFRNMGDEKYPVLETVETEEIGNPPSHEQGADAPGRSFASTGPRRSSYGETDWHQQAEDRFAAAAADRLDRIALRHDDGIVIVAPPRTLGELRKHYGTAVRKRLLAEIDKDLVGHMTSDVAGAITAYSP